MSELFHVPFVDAFYAHAELFGEMRGSFFGELLEQRLQLGVGGGERDAGLQFDQRAVIGARVAGDFQREIHVGVIPGEARGQNTDDRIVLVHKLQTAADHRRVAIEMPLPELIAQDHDQLRVLTVGRVGGNQRPAQQGGDAEIAAGVGCELDRRDILRQIFVRGREIPRSPAGGSAFDTFCLPPILELWACDPDPPVVSGFVEDDQVDHAVCALVWERVNQQAVDHAEDGRGGADAEGERQDGRESQAGLLAQLAPGEPQIVQHVLYTAEGRKSYVISTVRTKKDTLHLQSINCATPGWDRSLWLARPAANMPAARRSTSPRMRDRTPADRADSLCRADRRAGASIRALCPRPAERLPPSKRSRAT